MVDMVQELTSDLSENTDAFEEPRTTHNQMNAALVTGTTGSLGCHILCTLAKNPEISHIYAVNRVHAGGAPLFQRQMEVIGANGLDLSLLSNGKITLVEADFGNQSWCIERGLFEEVKL
jgi:nucleoside-diphosphate-sugar epimerase